MEILHLLLQGCPLTVPRSNPGLYVAFSKIIVEDFKELTNAFNTKCKIMYKYDLILG